MSGTVKTVLIVGGVAVGAFVLLRVLAPSPLGAARKPQANTDLVGGINGILGAAGALKGLFGSSDSGSSVSPQSAPYYGYGGGAYSTTQGIVGNELADHAVYGPEYQG